MEVIEAAARDRDLGRVQISVRLGGRVEPATGHNQRTALLLTDRGLFVVAADAAGKQAVIDLTTEPGLRYETGAWRDHLEVAGHRLTIPRGKARAVAQALALGRLRRPGTAPVVLRVGRFLEPMTSTDEAFVAGYLRGKERLLAWLVSKTETPIESSVLADATGAWRYALTDKRSMLVAISAVGDVRTEELEAGRLWTRKGRRRTVRSASGVQWEPSRKNAALFDELGRAAELDGAERVLEIARLNWLSRERSEGAQSFCRWLIDDARRGGHPTATLTAFLISEALEEPDPAKPDITAALGALAVRGGRDMNREIVADLWSNWGFRLEPGFSLLRKMREASCEPWAAELHRRLNRENDSKKSGLVDSARADLDLAEHLLAVGDAHRAASLLASRMSALPREGLEDLLPPEDADLTVGASSDLRKVRIQLHELLARARGRDGSDDPETCAELAALEPLVESRIRAVAAIAKGSLRERAEDVLDVVFTAGGLSRDIDDAAETEAQPLDDALLEGLVRHPLALEGHPLGWLQSMLATVEIPPYGMLRDYCERLDNRSRAKHSLDRAARVLGVSGLTGYVSRGQKEVGLRSYEATPPFALIGGRHLDPESDLVLGPRELDFAVGAEVAHLKFGHSRVTSRDVWAGAWDKSRQGIDIALTVLPALKGWRAADRLLGRVRDPAVRKFMRGAAVASDAVRKSIDESIPISEVDPSAISLRNEDIVAAHRVMQLTADRAGLLVCGDLAAAARAMLLVRPEYATEMATLQRDSLASVLKRRADDGHIAYLDLALRISALTAFYLSREWLELVAALRGESERLT